MSDLKADGSSVEESEVALNVLQGLPAGYKMTVEVLSLANDLTLDGILPKLLQTEHGAGTDDPRQQPKHPFRSYMVAHHPQSIIPDLSQNV